MRQEFQTHLLNERGLVAVSDVGQVFSDMLDKIETLIPPGRERAIVITKLQEACFFAKRAVAVLPDNMIIHNIA